MVMFELGLKSALDLSDVLFWLTLTRVLFFHFLLLLCVITCENDSRMDGKETDGSYS